MREIHEKPENSDYEASGELNYMDFGYVTEKGKLAKLGQDYDSAVQSIHQSPLQQNLAGKLQATEPKPFLKNWQQPSS